MNRRLQTERLCRLAALLLTTFRAAGQYYARAVPEEPRWITLDIDRAALGVYAEGYEMDSTTKGAPDYHQSRYFVGPLIGLGLHGSVYHPNLLTYRLEVDGSLGWSEDNYRGVVNQTVDQLRYLGAFSGDIKLLDSKPLNGRLFSTYAHTYQDYDFFNRVYVDTLRYGGGVHYTAGRFNVAGTVYRDVQDSTSYGTPMKSDSQVATVEASHNRDSGGTSLVGTINDYTRTDYGVLGNGQDYTLAASDSEDFGSQKQFHSIVNASYNHTESSSVPSDLYTGMGNLRIDHTDRLSSQYVVNYSRNSSEGALTDNLSGNATLRHQLFDSLTSELLMEGYRYTAGGDSDQLSSWQFGGGPGVHYTKQLSDSSRLSAYESVVLLHTDVQSTGGPIPVVDEPHSFGSTAGGGASGSFVLRQPNVIVSTIVITDTGHQRAYIRGLDYNAIANGQLVTIQRVTGSTMPDSVLVSYTFDASASGGYDTLNNLCGLRLDFFNYHWSLFTRFNFNQNYGAGTLPVQDLNDYVVGTEGNWRFARAGVEYEIYDSSLSPFKALRFYQNFNFRPEDDSSLSLNFNETFTDYEAAARSDQNYTGIVRYNRSLTRALTLTLELGASQRVGPGLDQTLAVIRPLLQYSAGSFTATLGYDYGYDEYLNTQTRIRNMGFIRIRKEF